MFPTCIFSPLWRSCLSTKNLSSQFTNLLLIPEITFKHSSCFFCPLICSSETWVLRQPPWKNWNYSQFASQTSNQHKVHLYNIISEESPKELLIKGKPHVLLLRTFFVFKAVHKTSTKERPQFLSIISKVLVL